MTLKRRKNNSINNSDIESLANELADKPYGAKIEEHKQDVITRVTVSLPSSMLSKLEDAALMNKRQSKDLKSVSAIIRYCVQKFFDSQ